MNRTFTIHETPNKQGLDRYHITADYGHPCIEIRRMETNDMATVDYEYIRWKMHEGEDEATLEQERWENERPR